MKARVIPVAAEALTSPHRSQMAGLEGVMLWPDDGAAAGRWHRAAFEEFAFEGDNLDHLDADSLRHLARWLRVRPPLLRDLQDSRNKQMVCGLAVGSETILALDGAMEGTFDRSFRTSRKAFSDLINQVVKPVVDGRLITRSPDELNKSAARFRPVAHLWAAYYLACQGDDFTFPCAAEHLGEFLANAEQLRRWAEDCKPARNSRYTIMTPGEAAVLPAEVRALLPPPMIVATVAANEG